MDAESASQIAELVSEAKVRLATAEDHDSLKCVLSDILQALEVLSGSALAEDARWQNAAAAVAADAAQWAAP